MLAQRFASASKPDAVTHVYQRPLTRPRSTTRSWPFVERVERVERALRVVAEHAREVVARAGRHDREPAAGVGRDARDLGDEAVAAARDEVVAVVGRGVAASFVGALGVGRDVRPLRAARPPRALELGEQLAGPAPTGHRIDDRGPRHGPEATACSSRRSVPRTVSRVRSRRDGSRPVADPDARRDRHGRQRSVGAAARPEAHRGSRGGRGGAVRHRRGRARDRAAVADRVRVLDRELAPAARRGALPDELQRAAAACRGATTCNERGVRVRFIGRRGGRVPAPGAAAHRGDRGADARATGG